MKEGDIRSIGIPSGITELVRSKETTVTKDIGRGRLDESHKKTLGFITEKNSSTFKAIQIGGLLCTNLNIH